MKDVNLKVFLAIGVELIDNLSSLVKLVVKEYVTLWSMKYVLV